MEIILTYDYVLTLLWLFIQDMLYCFEFVRGGIIDYGILTNSNFGLA